MVLENTIISPDQVSSPYIFLYEFNSPLILWSLRILMIAGAAAFLWAVVHMIRHYKAREENEEEMPQEEIFPEDPFPQEPPERLRENASENPPPPADNEQE